ncbi:MAG: serine hydrolase, partial [Planctomycetota bacterium]
SQRLARAGDCDEMLEHLESCDDDLKLPRLLPGGTRIAHKTGSVTRSRTAAGIIWYQSGCIEIAVLTDQNKDGSWSNDNRAELLCSRVAKAAYDFASGIGGSRDTRKTERNSSPGMLSQGAHGILVEGLQRTLNERIQAGLSVDGDFGPATAAAVLAFQKSAGLESTAIVDAATWQALGTLVEEQPVPDPDSINGSIQQRTEWWNPERAPETNAKAWAILERGTASLLDRNGSSQLPNASTTKLMTALLIAELVERDAKIWKRPIEFSKRADDTIGSTSGIRAGEIVPVSELLYGLLLPSGNDASVAFAEEFGKEAYEMVTGRKVSTPVTPAIQYELFVQAMNDRAQQLEMPNTLFANPHGLTEEGHYSSALDLARLGDEVLKKPQLKTVVSTLRRGCHVTSTSGYTRNVLWKNTNRLLTHTEFIGLKTGTTSAAGACLVAAADRDGREHIIVVLGCPTSGARYVDAKNLFRWTWTRQP